MQRKRWSEFSSQQLGRYAELFAKMEFMAYGYDIYTPEVDDHGVDFLAGKRDKEFLAIQVKSVNNYNYSFIRKNNIILDKNHIVAYVRFEDNKPPQLYLIPSTVWKKPNELFVSYDYSENGQTSKPEFGIRIAKCRLHMLEKFKAENVLI